MNRIDANFHYNFAKYKTANDAWWNLRKIYMRNTNWNIIWSTVISNI